MGEFNLLLLNVKILLAKKITNNNKLLIKITNLSLSNHRKTDQIQSNINLNKIIKIKIKIKIRIEIILKSD